MKALMDEVRFEEGGVVVHMRKGAGQAAKDAKGFRLSRLVSGF